MVNKLRISTIALSIACISTFSLYLAFQLRRRRKKCSCYLSYEFKPQSYFKRVLADNSFSPFKHLCLSDSNNAKSSNLHPYEREIMTLLNNPQTDYSIFNEISIIELSKSHIWVDSEAKLQALVNALTEEQVFGVDTEQHGLRSFLGFTALVQISTRKKDYLVDTIALHDSMHLLQSVFSDPNIVKVFHGADNDVLWLQRDFHIYVVNLFDTAKACEVLSKPQKSLAYLLETYCGVTTNKLLQRGDWRQRPLPEEMVEYAQSDVHYLLYIASCLIKELEAKDKDVNQPIDSESQDIRSNFLSEASRKSNATCLQLFCKESDSFPGESIASSIISRYLNGKGASSNTVGTEFQDYVRKLCAWRDLMARIHDESLRYVLSDQAIIALVEKRAQCKQEIYTIISQTEVDHDPLTPSFSATSPSLVISSHWEDIKCLLEEGQRKSTNDILQILLHNRLGPNGSCSLSIYNYNLLSGSNLKLANGSMFMQNGARSGKLPMRKASRELFVQKFSCKAPVYHNCRIFASDGRLLCYCDRRKLEWYLNRNLAKLMNDDPPAIMLLFEPKGRPEDEDNDFYIQSKRNICVSCGESNHYLRYRIIPSCYRIHFPEHLKSHRSHDIVLLCVDCHEVAHAAAEKYKRQVAKEFGIPLYVRRVFDCGELQVSETQSQEQEEVGVSPLQLRTAAMALLRHGQRMPSKRREELIQIVRTYYGGREISHEDLEKALLVGMSPYERRKIEKKKSSSYNQAFSNAMPRNNFTKDQTSNEELNNPNRLETPSCANDIIPIDRENTSENTNSPKTSVKKCNSKVSLLGHGPHGKEVVDYLLKNGGDDEIHQFCQRWRQVFVDALHPRYLPSGWDIQHSGRRAFGEFSVYNPEKKAVEL